MSCLWGFYGHPALPKPHGQNKALTEKKKSTQFQKGKSGNLAGRPKGSKNPSTILKEALEQGFEEALKKDFKKIVDALVKEAKKGNMQAIKMVMDRAIPVKKAVEFTSGDKGFGGVNIIIGSLEDRSIELIENDRVIDGEADNG